MQASNDDGQRDQRPQLLRRERLGQQILTNAR
jgi:hypothetical protein